MKSHTGIFCIILILFFSEQLHAQGDLLITPKRIVFENNKQKEEINLVNLGQDTAIYTISFVQYNMKEDGSFVIIEKPDSGQLFADPYLRVFPRKVTLAPREPQVISLQCRRNADMIPGEYRSHLYFRSEKNNKPLGAETSPTDTAKLKIALIPIYGLSIPVIIRSGLVDVKAGITNLKVETEANLIKAINLTITRNGNASLYGDVVIQFIPKRGSPSEIGRVNNLAVYTNITKRNLLIKLKTALNPILSPGKIKVQYLSKVENKITIHAEAEMDIQ